MTSGYNLFELLLHISRSLKFPNFHEFFFFFSSYAGAAKPGTNEIPLKEKKWFRISPDLVSNSSGGGGGQ